MFAHLGLPTSRGARASLCRRRLQACRYQTLFMLTVILGATWIVPRCGPAAAAAQTSRRPNIVLVMADDQGWGQTGYYNHPVLKTPNLDAMAANGLRFDRFYAGGPVCSPTRASVLTGRTHDRTGVYSHGYALRDQERTVAQALRKAGYATGHFGKWHLNGLRGPGVPILETDTHHPGAFGFDTWLSVTNFFDRNPILSRGGDFEEFMGDSSEIIVAEALKFIRKVSRHETPFFTVIWYGSPHGPWMASDDDKAALAQLNERSQNHYGELVAMDRSIGTLRAGLRDCGVADETLVWYCSDNGGLPGFTPGTVGNLRGFKGSVYEGGLRVPGIIEWPAGIPQPRVTSFPAGVVDIFPTLAEIVGLPAESMLSPQDGRSLTELFDNDLKRREKPLCFRFHKSLAMVDNNYKVVLHAKGKTTTLEVFDLDEDPGESHNLAAAQSELAARLQKTLMDWNTSVDQSDAGKDYPEGSVNPNQPERRMWRTVKAYERYFPEWKRRPEYRSAIK